MHTEAFTDGRLVIAITKFDANYNDKSVGTGSGSDSDYEEHSLGHSNCNLPYYVKVEEKAKQTLCDFIQDATQLDISPYVILPLCGQWALYGSKLKSYLLSHSDHLDDRRYTSRLRAATKALSQHPKRVELSIPGAQDQTEFESIRVLEPHTIVQYLEQVTGIHTLKQRYHSTINCTHIMH